MEFDAEFIAATREALQMVVSGNIDNKQAVCLITDYIKTRDFAAAEWERINCPNAPQQQAAP